MALQLLQTASALQPAQSPVTFAVSTGDGSYTASRFQYTCELYYWKGGLSDSASANLYTITKYPNLSGSGFFDFSRILNSTLRDNSIENTSSMLYYKPVFNSQYYDNAWIDGTAVTGKVGAVVDGYSLWPEGINSDISSKGLYPFLTDGPFTQSIFLEDKRTLSVDCTNGTKTIGYAGLYNDGSTYIETVSLVGGTNTGNRIKRAPLSPNAASFPLPLTNLVAFQVINDSTSILFNIQCEKKYIPVRIGFKNRFGQLDYFTFNKVSKENFNTTQRTYSPNAGNWNNSTFTADQYANQTQKYIVDTKQTLDVNTDYLTEDYNDIFKQLLVTDEIYLFNNDGSTVPLSIETNSMTFKKGVNDKLIQYSFRFAIGRNYKFII